MDPQKKSRRKKKTPPKKKKIDQQKLILKTSIDSIVAGLLSVGIFQSPTFLIESITGYWVIIGFITLLLILLFIYSKKYNKRLDFYTAGIGIIIALIEIFIIGIALDQSIEMISVVILIVIPSLLIFDKLMG